MSEPHSPHSAPSATSAHSPHSTTSTTSTSTSPARAIGVVGAGTMGSGIAQLAARAGARALLHDPVAHALARGASRAREGLTKEAAKGRLTAAQADAAAARIEPVDTLDALAGCELVIEAAPERIELKHELYRRLAEIVAEECVLASNTSSLPITTIASVVPHPERVVGMHFFNPAPLMPLLEIVAGALSGERALALATATGAAMGKDTIRAADGPGFLVNRCNRPFGLEALRLLSEGVADVQTIDAIVRRGGGFRMGPFELSDLVGVDTGLDVALSFHELSFGEPRWRPSPIQAQRVAAGLHGRKTGRGYYDYVGVDGEPIPHRPPDPDPPPRTAGAVIQGAGPVADALRELTGDYGPSEPTSHTPVPGSHTPVPDSPAPTPDSPAPTPGPLAQATGSPTPTPGPPAQASGARGPTIEVDGLGGLIAGEPFYALTPLALVETTGPAGDAAFAALGLHTARVAPSPGGVLPRIACQLVNESAFALGDGIGSADDIDTGMTLGLNHPRGPLAWGDQLGLDRVLALLDTLYEEYREERYRAAPALRRLVRAGRLGRTAGAGFFDYDSAAPSHA